MTTPKISFCTTCRGRLNHLRITLPANIKAAASYDNCEFVILDYDSPDGMEEWANVYLRPFMDCGRVIYGKVYACPEFLASHAKNVCHRLAQGDIVCNVDADNWLGRGFAEHVARLLSKSKAIVSAPANDVGVGGRIALFKQEFLDLGGYDETLLGYGFEDIDLVKRAESSGLAQQILADKYVLCLTHSNIERTAHMQWRDLDHTSKLNRIQSEQNVAEGKLRANHGRDWGRAAVKKNFDTWITT